MILRALRALWNAPMAVARAFGNFLYWCAGADPDLTGSDSLRRIERARYVCIGLSVMLTATAAGLSMTLVIGLIRHTFSPWHILAGVFWALFIFNVDRWLVSTIDYGKLDPNTNGDAPKFLFRVVGIFGRLLMALLIAAAVSEPVLLTIFDKEVTRQVEHNKTELQSHTAEEVRNSTKYVNQLGSKEHPELTPNTIEGRWYAAQQREIEAQKALNKAKQDLDDEVKGLHGTGRGCVLRRGSPCEHYTQEVENKQRELQQAQVDRAAAKTQYDKESADLEKQILAAIEDRNRIDSKVDGLLAREQALDQLTSGAGNRTLLIRVWVIRAIFIIVDLLPVMLKTFAPTTLHDRFVRIAAANRLLHKRRTLETARLAEEAHATAQRTVEKTRINADQEIQIERIATDREIEFEKIKLGRELDLQLLRWRHEERMRAGRMQFGGTTVIPRPRDPEDDEVTEPDSTFQPTPPPNGSNPNSTNPNSTNNGLTILNGRWVVTGRLPVADHGGFSDLLLAHDIHDPTREVVVKRARLAGGNPGIAQQAIKKDRYFQSKVRSPFVAPVLDNGEHELFGTFIVTPRYPATLSMRMPDGTRTATLEWSMRILEQVLLGLIDSWRTAGCVHLDIKPANIALDQDGDVRLIDFGLAKAVDGAVDLSTGVDAKFTRWYAPLEQILRRPDGGWATSACDVRAVGAIWYEMITRQRPLYREAIAAGLNPDRLGSDQFVKLLREHTPVSPRGVYPELPDSVDRLVMQWLEVNPAARVTGPLGERCHAELAREALLKVRRDVERRSLLDLPIPALVEDNTGHGGRGHWRPEEDATARPT